MNLDIVCPTIGNEFTVVLKVVKPFIKLVGLILESVAINAASNAPKFYYLTNTRN